jgi:hypothetical protein
MLARLHTRPTARLPPRGRNNAECGLPATGIAGSSRRRRLQPDNVARS